MKLIFFFAIAFSFLTIAQDNCSRFDYSPVIGIDGRMYMNECFMKKAGVQARQDQNWYSSDYNPYDTLTWYIYPVCTPIRQIPIEYGLWDGSLIYRNPEGDTLFRGKPNTCRCLSEETLIHTTTGQTLISDLKIGDSVLVLDNYRTWFRPILKISKIQTDPGYQMIRISLQDGRELTLSGTHPIASYERTVADLQVGEYFERSLIVLLEVVKYQGKYIYDILPDCQSGVYYANKIPLGSTLSDNYQITTTQRSQKERWLANTWQQSLLNTDLSVLPIPFQQSVPIWSLNLNGPYYSSNLPLGDQTIRDPSCLSLMGWNFIEGKRDTLAIEYSYQPYCNYGWDPAGPDDTGRPGPYPVHIKFIIEHLTATELTLLSADSAQRIHLVSPGGIEREQAELRTKICTQLEGTDQAELEMKGGLWVKKGKPFTGIVIEFHRNFRPAIQISKIIEVKKGIPHGSYREFSIDGYKTLEGQYSEGKQSGTWTRYNSYGNVQSTETFQ